jgi:DNA recombination protein RmuC
MGGHLDKTGRALGAAMQSYNKLVGSMETRVLPTARRFRDLKVTEAELSVPVPVEEPARVITAPELVEHAAQVEPLIGRTRRSALPEQAELTRAEPDLLDWAEPPKKPERRRGAGA